VPSLRQFLERPDGVISSNPPHSNERASAVSAKSGPLPSAGEGGQIELTLQRRPPSGKCWSSMWAEPRSRSLPPDKPRSAHFICPTLTPRQMVSGVKKLARGWTYDMVSIGYPGRSCTAARLPNHITSDVDGSGSTSQRRSAAR